MQTKSDIRIRRGILAQAGEIAAKALPASKCAVITDDIVDALYGDALEKSLQGAGFSTCRMAFPHGEENKNISTYASVIDFLAENRLTRKDAVVALGGGVVGDLVGFAAATYLRGIRLVQLPTTLLACVDSSVGGKTAIDIPAGKNLCGAFYQPHLILIDPDALSTLSDDIFADGMAEVIKYAAIADYSILDLCKNVHENIDEIIRRCVEIKKAIVEQDEHDNSVRQILNFGHTFGHAAEAVSGYSISHGKAVAIGMCIIARACAKRGICSEDIAEELISAIEKQGLPIRSPYAPEELFDAMLSDKKRVPDGLNLVLLTGRGACRIQKTPLDEAKDMLREGCK